MNKYYVILGLAMLVAAVGCDKPVEDEPPPVTIAEWKSMPVGQKYSREMLERLKKGDPKLQTPEGWESFAKTTLAATRKKDFPRK
jgi:hypothetical protein